MKVLQLIDSLATGGAEKLILDTTKYYIDYGIDIDVLVLHDKNYPFFMLLKENKDINLISLGEGSVYNPLLILKLIPHLKKYDIIHVHLFPAQYWVVIAKIISLSNTKLIFTEHSTSNKRLQNPKMKWIEKFIYKYYEKVICITGEVKDVLKCKLAINDYKLKVINNGVDLIIIRKAIKYSRSKFDYLEDHKIIIMVAGFREQKDQDTLIKALINLPNNYKLILIGDGQRKSICEQLVKDLELENRVKFLGVRTDVYSIMKMADIAILSSHCEGFGLVAVEAMACKIPLIASNVPGLAQVVEGAGILFEKGNSTELSKHIIHLCEDKEFYDLLVIKGLARAQKYDIPKMVKNTIKLYEEVLCKN